MFLKIEIDEQLFLYYTFWKKRWFILSFGLISSICNDFLMLCNILTFSHEHDGDHLTQEGRQEGKIDSGRKGKTHT